MRVASCTAVVEAGAYSNLWKVKQNGFFPPEHFYTTDMVC